MHGFFVINIIQILVPVEEECYVFLLLLYPAVGVTFRPVYKIITNFRMGGMSSGEKGYRETASLQYQYGAISKMRMWKIIMKSKLYEWVHK